MKHCEKSTATESTVYNASKTNNNRAENVSQIGVALRGGDAYISSDATSCEARWVVNVNDGDVVVTLYMFELNPRKCLPTTWWQVMLQCTSVDVFDERPFQALLCVGGRCNVEA